MLDFLPDGAETLSSILDTRKIYQSGQDFARLVAAGISPILLVIALWLRVAKAQLETLTSGAARWGQFAREVAIWLPILALYFAFATQISDFFNVLYRHFYNWGSADAINERLMSLLQPPDEGSSTGLLKLSKLIRETALLPFKAVYYCSVLLSVLFATLLQIIHALLYSLALSWGLVAIPLSLSGAVKLLRPWGMLCGLVLLWPIVHYLIHGLSAPLFEQLLSHFKTSSISDHMQFYMVMSLVNFSGCVLQLMAPKLAMMLLSAHAQSGAPIVTGMAAALPLMGAKNTSRLGGEWEPPRPKVMDKL